MFIFTSIYNNNKSLRLLLRLKASTLKASSRGVFFLGMSIFLVVSCSRKKDKFINRSFHAITSEFNALYNGYMSLDQGRQLLNDTYSDNYWETLPVERLEIMDEIVIAGQSKNEKFNRAEEKATKAIQKHSMNIEGKQKNPQIDEAYLLLGKARYFDQRFIPALEAFNYILYKYPASDKINQAKVWREKVNIRLDNDQLAIKNLKRLLRQETLEGQDLADATSILAQAYLNEKVIDTAIVQLEIAATATESNQERGRYRYIQGQLYNTLGYKDSANIAFDKVIALHRKTPRIYLINAYLEKIKNFDDALENRNDQIELLNQLELNRENRPFLDHIYHHIGKFHLNTNSDSLAVRYFNKSLRTNSKDEILKVTNYETLGDMNFDALRYAEAGKYYDSTLTHLVVDSKPYRTLKRKRDNLEEVIYYEELVKVDDSILSLIRMPESQRLTYFETYIETLKAIKAAEKKASETVANNTGLALSNPTVNGVVRQVSGANQSTVFYFYNPSTVAYGKNEFIKTWGDRPLEDAWRWSDKTVSKAMVNTAITAISEDTISSQTGEAQLFDVAFYVSQIPSEEKQIDSIKKERNQAYYQLGLLYKEKFKAYQLAKDKLQDLLQSKPEKSLILPSKYQLYKMYDLLGENQEATIAKNHIISTYPESRYASILANPDSVSDKDENSPESLYKALYLKFENQEYLDVISKSTLYINTYEDDPIVAKFDLLKATATGRLYGYDAYAKAVNDLVLTHANTPESNQAKNIISQVLPRLETKEFVQENDSVSNAYKVVFQFPNTDSKGIKKFKTTLDKALKNIKYHELHASVDVYNPHLTFVLVHGLRNPYVAKAFDQILMKEDQEKINLPYQTITSTNYKIVQIHKNWDAYLNLNNH